MSSIRPLITLTIIVVVGVFLFRKINEGPAHEPHGGTETFQAATIEAAPPLAATIPSPTAPQLASSTTIAEPAAPQWAEPVTESAPSGIPPIPALPPLAEAAPPVEPASPVAPVTPAVPTTSTASIDPPSSIPTARYGDEALSAVTPIPPAATPFDTAASMPMSSPMGEATSPVVDDRYGPIASSMPVSQAVEAVSPAPAVSPLAESWPEIQSALERQQLAQAHQKLSTFYGNTALSPIEAQQVETLLSQLAGTVVYSTEHRLEPPYVVHAGDTLETIAQKYEVPWQLLAKINGIPSADLVQPGQELKVVHGPFSAVVELGKGQLTLMLGDRYAGRFPVIAEPAAARVEGEWTLEQKLVNPVSTGDGVVSASYNSATPTVDRVLVLRSETPQSQGEVISIASGSTTPTGPTAVAPAAFRVSQRDAEELADILSVGSRVSIRR